MEVVLSKSSYAKPMVLESFSHKDIVSQVRYLEIELNEWVFGLRHSPGPEKGSLKDFRRLKELAFVPLRDSWTGIFTGGKESKDDGVAGYVQSFINMYTKFFADPAAEDPERTIPQIFIAEPEMEAQFL